MTALAATLLDQSQTVDVRGAIERLGSVVETEGGDRRRRERLHLDAGAIPCAHRGADADRAGLFVWLDDDLRSGDGDRMTERQQVGRALDAHHTRDAGRLERVALRRAGNELRAGLWRHRH